MAGAVQMLQEAAHQFDILDTRSNFQQYKLLVLPDDIQLTEKLGAELDEYVRGGGKLIVTGRSGLNEAGTRFMLGSLGVTLKANPTRALDGLPAGGREAGGRLQYVDYILPGQAIGKGLPPTEHAMYIKAVEVEAKPDGKVLAEVVASYFDRTWQHFCSHRQTPASGRVIQPGIVQRGGVIYFAHPIFTLYNRNAPRWCKQLVLNAIGLLLGEQLLTHNGPTSLLATVNEQPEERRWVVHLLHYIPERRSQEIDIIEDVIPLYDVRVSLKVDTSVKAVTCVPEMRALPFFRENGRLCFVLPKLEGHQMIEIAF